MYPQGDPLSPSLVDGPQVGRIYTNGERSDAGGLDEKRVVSPSSWRDGVGTLELKNTFISLRLLDPVKGVVDADSEEEGSPPDFTVDDDDDDAECLPESTCLLRMSSRVHKSLQGKVAYRRERSCPAAMKAGVCELVQHQGSTDPEFDDLEEGHRTLVCEGAVDDAAERKHDYQLTKRRRSPRKGRGSSFKTDNRSTAPTLMYTPGRRQGNFNHDYSNRRSSRGLVLGAARPANGLSSNCNKISNGNESSAADTRSTVMLRNIPYSMGQSRVLDALFTLGFQSKIDFFYAPLDFSSGNNLGYAFVNLRRPEYVDEFYNRLNDVCLSQLGDAWNVKRLQVCWARVQGFEANVEHYHNSPVIDMPEGYRPIVINDDGSRATFHHRHHQQDYPSNTTYIHRDRSCDETLKDTFSPVTPETSAVTPVRACEASCSGDLQLQQQQQQYLTYPWPSTNIRMSATDRRRYYSRAGRRPDPLDAVGPDGGLLTTPEFIPASMRNGRAHRHHHHHRRPTQGKDIPHFPQIEMGIVDGPTRLTSVLLASSQA
ncbi:hypothetical protein FOZ61_007911 [Perkinsus olseni]|uniref:Mei2-like C-terminal RNA recognition motif domain-containing protein n=1 Tax=Perkinsus olseni TaxID=32597 RepID=A0A7J6MUI0_PEROL|nr:hypothetical protein FOZ61_007911 [Perkinsus olseni]KAF4675259.1 hypothetical protein FOL46_002199 [Perkinsus olseni]